MREIEFRAKSKNKNFGWVYGCPVFSENDREYQLRPECSTAFHIEQETLGQYIGLKDKNGKKIFEGDIVKYHTESISFAVDTIGVVEFCEGTFGIASDKKQHFLSFYNMSSYVRYFEVIGNIFDNGELLNED